MKCQYENKMSETTVKCGHLSVSAGFNVSVGVATCDQCKADGFNFLPVEDSEGLKTLLITALRSRFTAGECPRYQTANPANVKNIMQKLIALGLPKKEVKRLLKDAFFRWTSITEENGGHEKGVVAALFGDVLEASGLPQGEKDGLINELIRR